MTDSATCVNRSSRRYGRKRRRRLSAMTIARIIGIILLLLLLWSLHEWVSSATVFYSDECLETRIVVTRSTRMRPRYNNYHYFVLAWIPNSKLWHKLSRVRINCVRTPHNGVIVELQRCKARVSNPW